MFTSSLQPAFALEPVTYFAKILYDNVYLYKTTESTDTSNIYFELPKTYFVELLELANDEYYKARYLSFTGYVKKESVQTVANAPSTPFLENITFRVYADLSRQLRSEPNISSTSSNLLATIPLYSRNLIYIGKIIGESIIDGRTNIWYFCKYTADIEYYGYVYSDFCDEIPKTLPQNNEEVTFVDNPLFEVETNAKPQTIPLNTNASGIIIAILTIPALIFVFLLIKGKNLISKEKYKHGEIKDY